MSQAFLAWYLYYTTTVTFPKISDSHLEKIERISDKQNATVEKVCESFESCIREERQARKEELRELQQTFKKMHGVLWLTQLSNQGHC